MILFNEGLHAISVECTESSFTDIISDIYSDEPVPRIYFGNEIIDSPMVQSFLHLQPKIILSSSVTVDFQYKIGSFDFLNAGVFPTGVQYDSFEELNKSFINGSNSGFFDFSCKNSVCKYTYKDLISKYDKTFFDKNSLIIVNCIDSIFHLPKLDGMFVLDHELFSSHTVSGNGTSKENIGYYGIFIEIPKESLKNIEYSGSIEYNLKSNAYIFGIETYENN